MLPPHASRDTTDWWLPHGRLRNLKGVYKRTGMYKIREETEAKKGAASDKSETETEARI